MDSHRRQRSQSRRRRPPSRRFVPPDSVVAAHILRQDYPPLHHTGVAGAARFGSRASTAAPRPSTVTRMARAALRRLGFPLRLGDHELTGAGVLLGVVDQRFDFDDVPPIGNIVDTFTMHPAATTPITNHGAHVARIASLVAPSAELLLADYDGTDGGLASVGRWPPGPLGVGISPSELRR